MFDEIVEIIRAHVEEKVKEGKVYEYNPFLFPEWTKGGEIVTRSELAYELGKHESKLLILWGKAENKIYVSEDSDGSLAVVVICEVIQNDKIEDYECFKAMRNAFYSIKLSGVTIRSLPSQLRVWLRVSKKAKTKGFNLGVFGRAILESMNSLSFVRATDVVILTSKKDFEAINDVFARAKRIIDVLIKMHEEKVLNCEECDYKDVCSEIPELKKVREKIRSV